MDRFLTNPKLRQLYTTVGELADRHEKSKRTLEQYLRTLYVAGCRFRDRRALTTAEFVSCLAEAFVSEIPSIEVGWRENYVPDPRHLPGFLQWEAAIQQQVVDLWEIAETVGLASAYRAMGADSPRGKLWHNFNPYGYLAGAANGAFIWWHLERGKDRVALVDEPPYAIQVLEGGQVGNLKTTKSHSLTIGFPQITWQMFVKFLENGRTYE